MKKIFAIAALMLASLSVNAHTFNAHWLNECTSVGTVSFEFKSEKVCDWLDYSDYESNPEGEDTILNDNFILVYHDPNLPLEYEELKVEKDLYMDWRKATAENRLIRVRIMWNPKAERFDMVPGTYVTWESEQDINYPEM